MTPRRPDTNTAAVQIATRARRLPGDVHDIVTALRARTPDGYPTASGGGRSSDVPDPTGNAALARTTGTGPGYRSADWHDFLLEQLAVMQAALDFIADVHAAVCRAHATEADRCNGAIDPTCTRLAAEQGGICDTCRLNACPACHRRPPATNPRRRLPSTGQLGCEACYKREVRTVPNIA